MISLLQFKLRRQSARAVAQQTNASFMRRLIRLLGGMLLIVLTHSLAMVWLEDMSLGDALWLTLTTVTTVGYGDLSATSGAGRLATVLLIYLVGIWLLAQLAGEYVDFLIDRRERRIKGLWHWKLHNMITIINAPHEDSDRYLTRLLEQIRSTPSIQDLPVLLVSDAYPEGLPLHLRNLGMVHNHCNPGSIALFDDIDLGVAQYIFVIAKDPANTQSDSLTLDILERLQRKQLPAYILAECIQDQNKSRFLHHGAQAVMRPIRAYPEVAVRALSAPGVEQLLENLFTHEGAYTARYEVELRSSRWQQIACAMIEAGLGTPLGYLTNQGEVITHPPAASPVEGRALLMVVNNQAVPEVKQIQQCLDQLTASSG